MLHGRDTYETGQRFHTAEGYSRQLSELFALVVGGYAGVPVNSRLFVSKCDNNHRKTRPVVRVVLDENDTAIRSPPLW